MGPETEAGQAQAAAPATSARPPAAGGDDDFLLQASEHGPVVVVTPLRDIDTAYALRMLELALVRARELGAQHLLFDLSRVGSRDGAAQQYQFARRAAALPWPPGMRLSVCAGERFQTHAFVEAMLHEFGVHTRFFRRPDRALAWALGQSLP